MWHSILMILKIVLLILAAVLGLGILVLALLLFVPVRYEIHIRKKEELQAEARVHWLLHLIRLPVSYRDGELSAKVKVLFFTVKDLLAQEQEIREGASEVFTDWEEDTEADREEQTETAAGQDTEEAVEKERLELGIADFLVPELLPHYQIGKPNTNDPQQAVITDGNTSEEFEQFGIGVPVDGK